WYCALSARHSNERERRVTLCSIQMVNARLACRRGAHRPLVDLATCTTSASSTGHCVRLVRTEKQMSRWRDGLSARELRLGLAPPQSPQHARGRVGFPRWSRCEARRRPSTENYAEMHLVGCQDDGPPVARRWGRPVALGKANLVPFRAALLLAPLAGSPSRYHGQR